jgi:tetratricopeptide (TPR) repeat protein
MRAAFSPDCKRRGQMNSMNRYLRLGLVILALAGEFAGAGARQQRKHAVSPTPAQKPAPQAAGEQHTDAIRQNNLGMALMDRHQFAEALGKFQTACVMNPESDAGCLNMGIALLNMPRYDDAERVLAKSAERDPQNPRAWFNLGLLNRAMQRPEAAAEDFGTVAALDPSDADTQYFLGYLAAQAQRYDRAVAAFKRAIELDPFHASAEYDLAQAEQHLGDADGAKAHMARFQYITSERLGKPIRFLYGEQGKYSLAAEMAEPQVAAPPAIPVHFVNVTSLLGLPSWAALTVAARVRPTGTGHADGKIDGPGGAVAGETLAQFLGSGACVFDYDGDGRPDIFLVNADGKGNAALYRNSGGETFTNVTKAAEIEFHGQGLGCAAGDYDNDGHTDLAISSDEGVTLFHNEGDGTFKDVTDEAGVRTSGFVLGVTFVDYDGDGDLDLYVTRFSDFPLEHPTQPFSFPADALPAGNVMWRNQGDGKFINVTEKLGLAGDAPTVGAIGTDTNNDGAIDLVLTGWRKFPALFQNTREGSFRSTNPWAISMAGPAAGAVALDFDGDGWMDLAFTHWAPPGLSIWRNVVGKSFERVALVTPGWMRGWGIATIDYDNDGWVDLVAVGETFAGEGRIVLLRNEGGTRGGNFRDVTSEVGLDKVVLHDPRSVIAFDYDGDGATDLLITQSNLPPVLLKNVGGNKNNRLQLAVSGDPDNKDGIGTRVDVFSGARRQTWEVSGASGYLGQGPAEVLAGLGTEGAADVIKLHWLTGLLQDEMTVPGGKRTAIAEADKDATAH